MKENYRLEGVYYEEGKPHRLGGNLHVVGGREVSLDLVDEDSSVKRRTAFGSVTRGKEKDVLDFLVEVPGTKILNFKYSLQWACTTCEENYSGSWTGTWEPVEKEMGPAGNGGAIDLPSGDTCYKVGGTKLTVKKEDKRQQQASLTLVAA